MRTAQQLHTCDPCFVVNTLATLPLRDTLFANPGASTLNAFLIVTPINKLA